LVRSVVAAGTAIMLATCARPSPPAPVAAAAPIAVSVPSAESRIPIPRAAAIRVDKPQAGIPTRDMVPLHQRPGGKSYAFMGALNEIGQRHRLPVIETRTKAGGETWLRVMLPHHDLGERAWVRSNELRLIRVRERIVVDLSSFTLRRFRNGRLLHRFTVGIGRPEYPTPLGTYFIMARLQQGLPNGPYGVYTLGTSAFSPVIDDGRVGIHGTADPGDRGQRVSHGCIRVYNTDMVKLRSVPIGTPLVFKQ
jgi:lipoprotein-anchoring transpeptidase ErfK/SrfK